MFEEFFSEVWGRRERIRLLYFRNLIWKTKLRRKEFGYIEILSEFGAGSKHCWLWMMKSRRDGVERFKLWGLIEVNGPIDVNQND